MKRLLPLYLNQLDARMDARLLCLDARFVFPLLLGEEKGSELIRLYYDIGIAIMEKQQNEGWGNKTIDHLSVDLHNSFPDMKGFSPRNLLYMKQFAEAYVDHTISQQLVAKLPWGHNVILIDKLDSNEQRLWYAQKTIEHGWSRAVLIHQIKSGLHKRQGKAITNFKQTLPRSQSDLAQQALKDPYIFDFLTLSDDAVERDLEKGLIVHIRNFLLELGVGFAFIGSQYHIEVEGEDFYIDLLFYHVRLRCYVVIDLKMEQFKPEFAGKMNFYLSAMDEQLRQDGDNPSIGIILCKTRKKLIAEYALRNTSTPIGVSEYKLTRTIPTTLRNNLPSIEELEKELGK